jgi:NagD protein
VAERVRREDDLVPVGGRLAVARRVHDAGVQQQPVQPRATAHGRGGGAHRAQVARVEQEGRDLGIRHLAPDRDARGGQLVRVAPGHDDVGAGTGELQRREEAEPGRRPVTRYRLPDRSGSIVGSQSSRATRRDYGRIAPLGWPHADTRRYRMLAHRHGRRPRPREQADPGAAELLAQWRDAGTPFLVLTNNPFYTPRDLSARLRISGLEVPEDRIWTSALATAEFLRSQHPGGTAFVIGEAGLTTALHEADTSRPRRSPTTSSSARRATTRSTASPRRSASSTGRASSSRTPMRRARPHRHRAGDRVVRRAHHARDGQGPYVVGKPNPMMFRSAMNRIGAHSENTGMIGDRMDTDVVAGIEAGLHTILVRTGISDDAEIERYPFRPDEILDSVADLLADEPAESEMPEGL